MFLVIYAIFNFKKTGKTKFYGFYVCWLNILRCFSWKCYEAASLNPPEENIVEMKNNTV